jgi:hypothetical protein
MKTENILIIGALIAGAYFFLNKNGNGASLATNAATTASNWDSGTDAASAKTNIKAVETIKENNPTASNADIVNAVVNAMPATTASGGTNYTKSTSSGTSSVNVSTFTPYIPSNVTVKSVAKTDSIAYKLGYIK